jgi:xylulokinase
LTVKSISDTLTGMQNAVLSVDIATSSSKGVLVDFEGTVLATATRQHRISRPRPGHVEMDAETWWVELVELSRELYVATRDVNHALATRQVR